MTDGTAIERPVLWGPVGPPVIFAPNNRGGSKVNLPSTAEQGQRRGAGVDTQKKTTNRKRHNKEI